MPDIKTVGIFSKPGVPAAWELAPKLDRVAARAGTAHPI